MSMCWGCGVSSFTSFRSDLEGRVINLPRQPGMQHLMLAIRQPVCIGTLLSASAVVVYAANGGLHNKIQVNMLYVLQHYQVLLNRLNSASVSYLLLSKSPNI